MSNNFNIAGEVVLENGLALAVHSVLIGNSSGVGVPVDTSSVGGILADSVNGLTIQSGYITNAMVNASAAIAYSKLALTGDIVNSDINASAAIAYSKLNLSASIVNADIASGAAIAYSKLALTGDIVNADINASAAIAYSKLNLSASVQASDINSGAASSGQVLTANGTGGASWSAASAGTVTSVALTMPAMFNVGGSPITSSGTLAVTLANESANQVFAGPSSGGAAAPTFRSLVAADMPDLSATYELVSNFAVRSYQGSITLAANVSTPTTITALTFAFASYGSMQMEYQMTEASTGVRRTGKFMVCTDGTLVDYSDTFNQTAVIGNGIVLSAAVSGSNVIIQFTGTGSSNAVAMKAQISQFAA